MKNESLTFRILKENIIVHFKAGMSPSEIDNIAKEAAAAEIKRSLGVKPIRCMIHRKSVDARRKGNIRFVLSVCAQIEASERLLSKIHSIGMKMYTEPKFEIRKVGRKPYVRPCIAGFGPAGMFCALVLAENGYRPIVYERGASVEKRISSVEHFMKSGILDPNSNIQFGAGGAGTFSDGKLTTRIGDPMISYVLSTLKSLGAPEDIEWKARPHIGTDILRNVVCEADLRIKAFGGEIYYNQKVDVLKDEVRINGTETDCGLLVLATGHSARDTYIELLEAGFEIDPKPFSAGVRIEHLQTWLDYAMFGDFAGDETLGRAEYSLSMREGRRGVYSFCMCPGGEVVAAASEAGGVVTNGMSRRSRDGLNSNAAIAVSVLPEDYGATPIGAIDFQRKLERLAYAAGGGDFSAPVQTVGDFMSGRHGTEMTKVIPTYMGGRVRLCDLHDVLPPFICSMIQDGLLCFGKKIKGFDEPFIPLTGVETRTSSPVRILRNENYTASGHSRFYPCGEGAGYAGGIVSAAIDGLRVARAIIEEYSPE